MVLTQRNEKRPFKRAAALMLTVLFVLNPVLPIFECGEVGAADNSNWRGIWQTPADLVDGTYNTSENGTAGYINFGKRPEVNYDNSMNQCTAYAGTIKWLITGKDTDGNIVLYSEEPLMSAKFYDTDSNSIFSELTEFPYTKIDPVFGRVHVNHYGSSNFRKNLQNIEANPNYFSSVEQGLMLGTVVQNTDIFNDVKYTTEDKLYGLYCDYNGRKDIYAGENNSLPVNIKYWKGMHWLRSSEGPNTIRVLSAYVGYGTSSRVVDYNDTTAAAALKLNLSSLLFASSAAISTSTSGGNSFQTLSSYSVPEFNLRISGATMGGVVSANADKITYTANTDERLVVLAQSTSGGTTYQYVKNGTGSSETLELSLLGGLTTGTTYSVKAWTEKKAICGNAPMYYASTPAQFTFTYISTVDPTVSTTTNVTYAPGLTLKDVPPPSTDGKTDGTWEWVSPNSLVGDVGTHMADATFTPSDTNAYNTVKKTITITVTKATLTASNFTFTPPSNLTYNGSAKTAIVTANSGITGIGATALKYYDSGDNQVSPVDVGTYTVKIDVAAGMNYEKATGLSNNWSFTITQAIPNNPETPTASAITYGNKLSTSTLSKSGWQWESPDVVPTVTNTGYSVYYTVPDYTNYDWSSIEGYNSSTHRVVRTIPLTVKPATPSYTTPTGLKAVYGQTLANVGLPVNWEWVSALTTPVGSVGVNSFKATYTPIDTLNYQQVTEDVNITVSKADPIYTIPASLSAIYEDTLKDVILPAPVAGQTPGSWKWDQDDSTSIGIVGTHEFTATFTPTDTKNYNSVPNVTFNVIVSPKPATDPSTPNAGETTYSPTQTLADISLPDGWEWADSTVKPTAPVNTYTAYYAIDDDVNYDWSKILGYDQVNCRVARNVPLIVKKANPSSEPGDLTAVWGQILSDIELPTLEEGNWIWDLPSTSVNNAGGTYQYPARFVPNDGDNYNIVQKDINVTVEKATPSLPEGLSGTYGKKLGDIEFNQPNIGTWTWKNPSTRLDTIGDNTFLADFVPKSDNYLGVNDVAVKVYVNRKPIDSEDIVVSGVEESYEYDGSSASIQPKVTVKDGEKTLEENIDYVVGYKESGWSTEKNTAQGTVMIVGIGNYTETKKLNFDIIDKVIPSGTIYIENDNNMAFSLFDSRVNFGYAFSGEKQINIEGRDAESGINSIYYHISTENLFPAKKNGEKYTNEEIENKVNTLGGWTRYDNNNPFALEKGTKNIIYAKIVDNNNNVKYINSQGIIVYEDVSTITGITYTKTTKTDAEIVSDLHKNTIKEIRINGEALTEGEDEQYTIFDSDGATKVKLNGEYLDSLSAEECTVAVSYNPMGEEFNDKFMEGDKPEDITIKINVERADLTEEDFIYQNPEDLIYDGGVKEASVTSKLDTVGEITVKYYKDRSNAPAYTAPTEVGSYKVRIDVEESDNYVGKTDITADDWNFTIKYLEVEQNPPYQILGSVYESGGTYWLKDETQATIKAVDALSNYTISRTLNSGYSSDLKVDSWTAADPIYLRDPEGHMTNSVAISEDIKQDATAPKGSIALKNREPWQDFVNLITFGLFFKDAQTVTITATDDESGISESKYLISGSDLIQNAGANANEISEKLDNQTNWEVFTDGSIEISLEKDNKYVVYEKIIDNVGHVTYRSSDGIVVYSDSKTDTNEISYIKTSMEDIEVEITTNGNTVKDIKIGSDEIESQNYTAISSNDYEVSAENENKQRTITFKGTYSETLPVGTYELTISYNPLGLEYKAEESNDKPETTTLKLVVSRESITANSFNFTQPSDLIYDGGVKEASVTSKLDTVGEITVKYYKDRSNAPTYTAPTEVGSYKVRIDVEESDNYVGKTDITADDWNFTIKYLEVEQNPPYQILGPVYESGGTYWLKDETQATIKAVDALSNYTISRTLNSGYSSDLKVDSWTAADPIYLRDPEGHMTNSVAINEDIKQDATAPKGSIALKNREPWQDFVNLITFGLFFKDAQTVTITATDDESGISESKYLISGSDLIQNASANADEISEKLDNQTNWEVFTDGSIEISLEKDNKYVVYEKIIDNVGHVTYRSSDGIVVYSDSKTDTDTIEYIKKTKWSILVAVTTNGNTVKDIKIGSDEIESQNYTAISSNDYEVSAENENKQRTITFKGTYLETLPVGTYKLTISYNPLGEAYINGIGEEEKPKATQIELLVKFTNIDTDGDGKPDLNIDTDGDGEPDVNVDTDGDGKPDLNVDTDGDGKPDLNIDTDGDGEPDVNVDTDGDGKPDLNVDTNGDGKPDLNVDTDGDGEPDVNVDTDGNGKPDLNIDTNGDGKPDLNVDTDGDGEPDVNVDMDGDGKPDLNVDTDGDGYPNINVDKSGWGEKVENNGIFNYVAPDGTTSAEVTERGMIWLKEESNGTSAWYAIDNSKGVFEIGSRFWVRWLSPEIDSVEWQKYYENLDEQNKKSVDSNKLWIFLTGVTHPDGNEYTNFDGELQYYIQLGQDWDKDDINAVFISSGTDEIIDVAYLSSMDFPGENDEFAKLTLKHFSPYAIYDELTDEERKVLEKNNNNGLLEILGLVATGDENTPLILTWLTLLVVVSGAAIIVLKKKHKK